MRPVSIRLRLSAVFTVLVAATLVLVGVLTYQLLRQNLLAEIERDVARRAATLAAAAPAPPYQLDTFDAPDVFLQVTGADGAPVARSGNLGAVTLPTPAKARGDHVVEVRVDDRPLFLTTAPIDDGRRIVVARSPMTTYGALSTLRGLLIAIVGGAVVLTALVSWLYARAALRPIGTVVDAARDVRDSRDLSRRVRHTGPQDEVGRLVHTFNEMLAELQDAYRSLDASNQRMRQFLADCSHELRAPLTRIRSTVDLLGRIDEPDPADDAFRSRALADITAETDRMARMVRQLLILARADAGASIEPRPVRLDNVIANACRQADRMANGITLHTPTEPALAGAVVQGDAEHLEQALLILLDNAFKYTPEPGQVTITASQRADTAAITVADTGLGIPDEDTERIFERFYRGRNASAATGTGLGLAIAHWIADQHGGRIDLSSTPDAGSRFTLNLPLSNDDK